MKILCTGAYGFIGSQFVKMLIEDYPEVEVRAFARNSDQRKSMRLHPYHNHHRLRLVFGDLTDINSVSGICEHIDVVVNFAAKTYVDHSIKDASAFVQSNVIGTYNLLEEARKNRVKKYVQVSTDEVYGSILEGAYSEDAPLNPTNPYSATKAAADMLVQSYGSTYGLKYIITRTENNYGKFQHPQKALPVFVKHALAEVKIPVYGDGKHRRMWIRVEDHCLAIMHLISLEREGIYHVAGEQELENIELAERILSILKKPKSLIELVPDFNIRPGHDRRYALDVTKLKASGWRPKWNLKDGLEDAVKWYKDNDWWLYG